MPLTTTVELDNSRIYLHAKLDENTGLYRLFDQDGRRVSGVRGLSLDFAYDDVSTFTLRAMLHVPPVEGESYSPLLHMNKVRCQSKA